MATFSYVARDQLGKVQEGTADAENDQILVRRLREQRHVAPRVVAHGVVQLLVGGVLRRGATASL